jgi:hypothetical protein
LANLGSNFSQQVQSLGKQYAEQAKNILQVQDADTIENLKHVFGYDTVASTPAGQTLIKRLEQ